MKKIIFYFLLLGGVTVNSFADSFEIKLPSANIVGSVSLEKTLDERQSVRAYKNVPLDLEQLSQVLWAAYGKNKWRKITAPSAGARYPLVMYVCVGNVKDIAPGMYRYNPQEHAMTLLSKEDKRDKLTEAAYRQKFISQAPAVIVISANYSLTFSHYGERGIRYVAMESGHASQNLYLQATALKLGTVAVGAFIDEKVQEALAIKEDPLYIMPVGFPD